jgi:hypothetical protein
MSSVLKSLLFGACLGLFSVLALGQGTSCSADGENAKGSPIACVTGEGVQIKGASTTEPQKTDALPLAPEQRPAARPIVIFENGSLTIMANNSTLQDILEIVGEKTGAVIDLPGAAPERVVSQLGPGKPRDVIASLLNGSHFNYVVVGTETDTNAIARVVLTAKSDHPDAPGAPNNGRPGFASAAITRPMMQPRNSLQQALAQAQEVIQQQVPQQIQSADIQQPPVASASETPAPVNQASSGGGETPAPAGPSGTETAAIDQPSSDGVQKSNGERTQQQMLQDLYETRRQMMQHQQDQQAKQQQQQQ